MGPGWPDGWRRPGRRYETLSRRTGLSEDEVARWEDAAEAMYLPYDDAQGIHPQDDAFLELEPWDFDRTPTDQYPLLLNFHPLVIYRHQVLKQADVVLAMFLRGEQFDHDQKRRNFEYYDPITTGDSSLSACVQAIVAAEVGHREPACATSCTPCTSTSATPTATPPMVCTSPTPAACGPRSCVGSPG